MRMRTVISKCYLVQITDEDGNELACEYVFGDKDAAKEAGRVLKAGLMEEHHKKDASESVFQD